MRVLLDESVPRQLRRCLSGHVVRTARDLKWDGKSNGELLALGRDNFDAFITADQHIEHQQHITEEDIPIIVLIARCNRIVDYLPIIPYILSALTNAKRGEVIRIPER